MTKKIDPEIKLPKKLCPFDGVRAQIINLEEYCNVKPPFNSMIVELDPTAETASDHHHPFPECWVVLQGNGLLIHNGRPIEISKGQVFYFKSNEIHQIKNTGKEPLFYFSIDWKENEK